MELNIISENINKIYGMIKVIEVYCEFNEENSETLALLPVLYCIKKELDKIYDLF